jgi:hypothetical protein
MVVLVNEVNVTAGANAEGSWVVELRRGTWSINITDLTNSCDGRDDRLTSSSIAVFGVKKKKERKEKAVVLGQYCGRRNDTSSTKMCSHTLQSYEFGCCQSQRHRQCRRLGPLHNLPA